MEKDDFLLSQIDEFREKAKQLQQLVSAKESKVQELQSIVNEREDKAEELQQILTERQEEADKISMDFNQKVNHLTASVTRKMAEIEANISGQISEVQKMGSPQLDIAKMERVKAELSEKIHTENVRCYRNIQELFHEFDSKIEKLDRVEREMDSIKGYVACLSWFSILNFILLVGFILFSLGIFNF